MSALFMGFLFAVWTFLGLVGMLAFGVLLHLRWIVGRAERGPLSRRLVTKLRGLRWQWQKRRALRKWERSEDARRERAMWKSQDKILHLDAADKLIESVGGTVRK